MPGDEVYVQGISDCHDDIKSVLLVRHHCSDEFPFKRGFDVLVVPTNDARDLDGRPAKPRMVFADYDDVFSFAVNGSIIDTFGCLADDVSGDEDPGTPPPSPTPTTARTPPPQRRTPPKRRRGRPRVRRQCVDDGFDYENWCRPCQYGRDKLDGNFKDRCRGPRLIPPPGSAFDNPPPAPAEQPHDELLGRFVQKKFNVGLGLGNRTTKTFLGMVKARHEDGTYLILYDDGDCEDLDKHEVEGILRPAHLRPPRWSEPTAAAADCGRNLTVVRAGGTGRSKYAYADPELRTQRDAAVAARRAAERKLAALRQRLQRVRRELAHTLVDQDGVPGPLRRMERAAATGQGFSATRTRREHTANWESRIMETYPTDIQKQISVAVDLARRYCVAASSECTTTIAGVEYSQSDIEVCVAIAESLKAFCAKLRSASTGRMHNSLRLPYRLAAMAASLPGANDACAGIRRRADWLDIGAVLCKSERRRYLSWAAAFNRHILNEDGSTDEAKENEAAADHETKQNEAAADHEAKENEAAADHNEAKENETAAAKAARRAARRAADAARTKAYGELPSLFSMRGAKRKDRFPDEWAVYIAASWVEVARQSEVARDEVRDKRSDDPHARVRKAWLEVRVGVAIKAITAMCKDHFTADFKYADGVKRRKGFTAGAEYIRLLRPFFVIKAYGKRATSLCTYHMKWEFICKAINKHQKAVREKGHVPKEQPTLPYDWADLLRCCFCARTNPMFGNKKCIENKCEKCRNLRLLVGDDGNGGSLLQANEISAPVAIKWERWLKSMNPVTGNPGWDFATVTTPFREVIKELMPPYTPPSSALGPRRGWFYEFCKHHDLAKWMNHEKKYRRRHFPRGAIHCVQDFSENGGFVVNKEHQSRYYQTHQYTVYGMIVDSHVEDHADFDEQEKAALIALLDANNLPHIITQSHIVCSEDTVHDPAAVMHYNVKVLFPAIKEQLPGVTTIYMSTDGAPTQYMHADIYYFISRCKIQHGLRLSWVIGCAAHGKDLSDSECGGAKHCVDYVNLQHNASDDHHGTRISTVPEAVRHLEQPYPVGYATTKKTLAEKKGTGIHSRIIHHVPLRTISRRITHCDNFDGSKQMHQFLDIGEEGKILVRRRPCHFCPGCMALDKEKIINDCVNKDRCGIAEIVEVKPKSGARAEVAADSNAIWEEGRRLSRAAELGDYVAVELAFDNLPFLVGEVIGAAFIYDGNEKNVYMGKLKPGDEVLRVRRWLPLQCGGGSSIFEEISSAEGGEVLAFVEDVRCLMKKDTLAREFKLVRNRRTAPTVMNVKASAGAKIEYMFADRPGTWFKGKVRHMNADGLTAYVDFDDGDHWTQLIVWGDLQGGRIKIVEGGVPVATLSTTAPQRRLSAAVRDLIQHAIC